MRRTVSVLYTGLVCTFALTTGPWSTPAAREQAAPAYDVKASYRKSEHDIPMRDGVKLHTTIYAPLRADENG